MRVIGLVGGVASGKSFVGRLFAELGAGLLDADRAAHEILQQDEVREAVRKRFGERVFDERGKVDRGKLAQLVFPSGPEHEENRKYLEGLIHPRVGQELDRQQRACRERGMQAVILDVPLLLEAGMDGLCDAVVMVDASRDVRLRRARERGWSEAQFDAREAAQMPLDDKRSRADYIIDNSGTEAETANQVKHVWQALVD